MGLALRLATGSAIATIAVSIAIPTEAQVQSAESATQGGIEEIVVTARRRNENLQDTPIAITAFSRADIAARGLDDVSEIAQSTPNLVFDGAVTLSGSSASSAVTIRGIGQTDFTFNADPGVGTYVDGVYISRSVGGLINLLDIERVEVLRGPQGTLFGKNSTGGAISITTIAPDDQLAGRINLTTGRYNRAEISGGLNLPIAPGLAARATIAYRNRDGYVESLQGGEDFGGVDSLSGRLRLRFEPNERLTIDLVADGTRERQSALPIVLIGSINPLGSPFAAAFNGRALPMGGCFAPSGARNPACFTSQWVSGPFASNSNPNSRNELDLWGVNGTLQYGLSEEISIKSITAYRTFDSFVTTDLDGSPLVVFDGTVNQNLDAFSQELQLTGDMLDSRFNWIVGGYYLNERGSHIERIATAIGRLNAGGLTVNRSTAAFAQATYELTEQLSVTAGVRYTDETRTYTPSSSFFNLPTGVLVILPNQPFGISAKKTTPLLNIAYEINDTLNVYATYSQGFKSGGFSQRIVSPLPAPPSFGPESVDLYEIGAKFQSSDNRLRVNAAIFQSNYNDVQVLGLVPDVVGAATVNAGQARVRGVELEVTAVPVPALQLGFGLGYLDAKYTRLDANVVGFTLSDPLPDTPEWSLSASAAYTIDFGGTAKLTPRLDWSYQSQSSNVATVIPVLIQPGYHLVNALVTLQLGDKKWRITGGIKNLTNTTYLISGNNTVALGASYGTYALPRTWSLGLEYNF